MTTAIGRPGPRERAGAAVSAAVVLAALGAALIAGLVIHSSSSLPDAVKAFAVPPPAPPPVERVMPKKVAATRPSGAASLPNLHAKATEIVAPPPVIPVPTTPVVAAPEPASGSAAFSGAADIAGPGSGAGGQGDGFGAGGNGYGDGRGGDTPPHRVRGRLKDSDYPRGAAELGAGGTVSVRYVVGVNGRVLRCEVTRSSGNAELDDTTCRLIGSRFRFDPSRDRQGRPVESIIVENHSWDMPPPDGHTRPD